MPWAGSSESSGDDASLPHTCPKRLAKLGFQGQFHLYPAIETPARGRNKEEAGEKRRMLEAKARARRHEH